MYLDDKVYYFDDEISIILTLALLWQVCKQFSMNGYRHRVWVGSNGLMFVSCFSVSVVVSGFLMLHNPCGVCYSPVADTTRIVQHKKSHS